MSRQAHGKTMAFFIAAALLGALAIPSYAQKKGDSGKVRVNATFRDAASDKVKSDLGGPYADGQQGVKAEIDKFRFQLYLGEPDTAIRKFFLDFTGCASPGECTPPFAADLTQGGSVFASKQGDLLKIPVGGTVGDYKLQVVFRLPTDPSHPWFVYFAPGNCPGSSPISVTRVDQNTWRFAADGDSAVACLERQEGSVGEHSSHGLYKMPLAITAVRQ